MTMMEYNYVIVFCYVSLNLSSIKTHIIYEIYILKCCYKQPALAQVS